MSLRSALLFALALVCLAGAYWVGFRSGQSAEAEVTEGSTPPRLPRSKGSSTESRSIGGQQIAGMSLETVLRLLPAEPYEMVLMGDDGDPERDALLRRLGQLLGEEGVDEVLDRYGLGSCAMHAMGRVFEGWMAVNPDAATAAFLTLNDADANGLEALIASPTGSPVMFHSDSVQWKGQRLVPTEWGMFSRVAIWNLYGGVLRAATMADPKRPQFGLSLLAWLSP